MKRHSQASLPIPQGIFQLCAYAESEDEKMPHLALYSDDIDTTKPVIVRIHSECLTGDLFGSKRCDCGEQLERALEIISKSKGILIYLRQEGRGIGLIQKLKAYQLQDQGMNTIDANLHLGYEIDERSYEDAIKILKDMGISKINLLTNNPDKIKAFDDSGIELVDRLSLVTNPIEENEAYLEVKKNILGHLF